MNIFNKYIWLVNTLRRHKSGATLRELSNEWLESDLNVDGSELNARTFFRWKEGVMDQFGIIIECDERNGYKYYIENDSELEENRTTAWMLHTMTISNIIEEYKGSKERILLEDVPSGEQYLMPLLQAIKRNNQVRLTYQRFQEDNARVPTIINPLCVRLFNRRWYAVVDYVEEAKRRVIGLDRIVGLEVLKMQFTYPKDFDANEYFAYDYGIETGYREVPQTIRLKVKAQQRPYTRALPLHHSQKEVEIYDTHSIFEYFLKPSRSFARAILPFGMNYEVLEPVDFRNQLKTMAKEIVDNNK